MGNQSALSNVLYALSDPSRLAIIRLLHRNGEMLCGSFSEAVGISKPTLSHHFSILREAGIIQTRIDGNQKFNSLNREGLNKSFPGLLDAVLNSID
ncbi:MAG: metalloregulator ArsR/SmtB family transcription factor [Oligoflexia bacterium]|nr:metalloregulator ArsR/SmtB family transcription factor [Oligoflexia bacterium]